jgi:hypothetical protein
MRAPGRPRLTVPVVVATLAASFTTARAAPPVEPAPDRGRDAAVEQRVPLVTPTLARQAIAVALAAAGHPAVRRLLSSLAGRARSSAILPEVVLRAARSTNDALRLSPTVDDPYHYSESGGVGWWLEARLVWHLDRLVFDRDEIAVERLRAEREGDAAKLAKRVVDTLFDWQRAAFSADDPASSDEDRQAAALAEAEAEVVLDVLTDGWFTARTRGESRRPAPATGKAAHSEVYAPP